MPRMWMNIHCEQAVEPPLSEDLQTCQTQGLRSTCGSGFTREANTAVDGTGFAGVRGQARPPQVLHRPGSSHTC